MPLVNDDTFSVFLPLSLRLNDALTLPDKSNIAALALPDTEPEIRISDTEEHR